MLAPEIKKFYPLPATNYWNNSGVRSRRPFFKDKAHTKPVHTFQLQTPPVTAAGDSNVVMVYEQSATNEESAEW